MGIRWTRIGIPLCIFDRHAPVREKARWNGKHYSGHCRNCGLAVIRKARGVWQAASRAAAREG